MVKTHGFPVKMFRQTNPVISFFNLHFPMVFPWFSVKLWFSNPLKSILLRFFHVFSYPFGETNGTSAAGSWGTLEIRAFRPLHPDANASRLVEIAVKRWVVPLGRICWVILDQKKSGKKSGIFMKNIEAFEKKHLIGRSWRWMGYIMRFSAPQRMCENCYIFVFFFVFFWCFDFAFYLCVFSCFFPVLRVVVFLYSSLFGFVNVFVSLCYSCV